MKKILSLERLVPGRTKMTQGFEKEHLVETFKSMIQISVAGLKLLALINGGAAVALLSYLGNVAREDARPDMRFPMECYLVGLLLCGLAFVASYLTQYTLFDELMGQPGGIGRRHRLWHWCGILFALLSLAAFGIGSYCAALRFQS